MINGELCSIRLIVFTQKMVQMNIINYFKRLIIFLIDATVSVFIFQIVALLISYFYFLPPFPGICIVWILYYIIAYWKYRRTLGQAFFNAGITTKDNKQPLVLRIIFREAFTSFPAIMLWILGWNQLIASRVFFVLLICLLLLRFRRKIFGISVQDNKTLSERKCILRLRYVYFLLIITGIVARFLNIIGTNDEAIYTDSPLYASPRPTPHSVGRYVDFLKDNRKDINDYVMGLFDKYDHVILCERHHQEMTQYDMIYNLVTDKRFVDKVGVMFTEIGCVESRKAYKEFVDTTYPNDTLVEKGLASFMTENQSVHLLWPNTNWFSFLKRMYYFNHHNPKQVEILFADRNWLDRSMLEARDSIMADNIISTILSDSIQKSLIIMNYRHAYLTSGNCGNYISQKFPDKVANVMINFGKADLISAILKPGNEMIKPIQYGKWDVAFEQIEDSDFAFDFSESPFGKDRFDHFFIPTSSVNTLQYQDIFNGFIYYKAPEEQYTSLGYPYIFDSGNIKKLKNREHILKGYSLESWEFLKDGLIVTEGKEIYYEIYQMENFVFLGVCILSFILNLGLIILEGKYRLTDLH